MAGAEEGSGRRSFDKSSFDKTGSSKPLLSAADAVAMGMDCSF